MRIRVKPERILTIARPIGNFEVISRFFDFFFGFSLEITNEMPMLKFPVFCETFPECCEIFSVCCETLRLLWNFSSFGVKLTGNHFEIFLWNGIFWPASDDPYILHWLKCHVKIDRKGAKNSRFLNKHEEKSVKNKFNELTPFFTKTRSHDKPLKI